MIVQIAASDGVLYYLTDKGVVFKAYEEQVADPTYECGYRIDQRRELVAP